MPKRTIVVRTRDKPWYDDRCALARRAKQRVYKVWSRSRSQADWEEYRVARGRTQLVYRDIERPFTDRSKLLLTNVQNSR